MPALSGAGARASARRSTPRHRLAVSPERRTSPWTARKACLGREGCRRTCASRPGNRAPAARSRYHRARDRGTSGAGSRVRPRSSRLLCRLGVRGAQYLRRSRRPRCVIDATQDPLRLCSLGRIGLWAGPAPRTVSFRRTLRPSAATAQRPRRSFGSEQPIRWPYTRLATSAPARIARGISAVSSTTASRRARSSFLARESRVTEYSIPVERHSSSKPPSASTATPST